ncbi:MAG: alpha/beta fold hydrolase [Clostridia bacterium]|nr:alpha/beta fold hydrolase [Clostridia bacterium]
MVKENYLSVTGGKIWYKIAGAEKEGTPIILIHGGPGATHDYLEPLEALSDKRPVIFYDQLGCGKSDKPNDSSLWTIERFVEELDLLCKTLNYPEYHILGQSWGGTLAVEHALSGKFKGIKSLILSAPLISSSRWAEDQKAYIDQMPDLMRSTIIRCETEMDFNNREYQEALAEFYNRHLCRIQPLPGPMQKTFEQMNAEMYAYMWGPSEFTVNGTCKDYDSSDRINGIKVPVLFTAGEFDEATPESLRYFSNKIEGSKVIVFEDSSHSHHLEKQEEYISVVRDFLKEVEN